jgi:hypothetical protein
MAQPEMGCRVGLENALRHLVHHKVVVDVTAVKGSDKAVHQKLLTSSVMGSHRCGKPFQDNMINPCVMFMSSHKLAVALNSVSLCSLNPANLFLHLCMSR